MEAADVLIKSVDWNPALHPRAGTPPIPAGSHQRTAQVANHFQHERRKTTIRRIARMPLQMRVTSGSGCGPDQSASMSSRISLNGSPTPSRKTTGDKSGDQTLFLRVGDQGSAAALNSALTVLLRPGITKEDRQRILDHQLDALPTPILARTHKSESWRPAPHSWQAACHRSLLARPRRQSRPRRRGPMVGRGEDNISINCSVTDRYPRCFELSTTSPMVSRSTSSPSTSMPPLIRMLHA